MSWEQKQQQLLAAGDSPKIRLWDAEKELKICDIPSGTDTSVTSISSDKTSKAFGTHIYLIHKVKRLCCCTSNPYIESSYYDLSNKVKEITKKNLKIELHTAVLA